MILNQLLLPSRRENVSDSDARIDERDARVAEKRSPIDRNIDGDVRKSVFRADGSRESAAKNIILPHLGIDAAVKPRADVARKASVETQIYMQIVQCFEDVAVLGALAVEQIELHAKKPFNRLLDMRGLIE